MDRSDSEDIIQLIRTDMGLNTKEKRFPRKQTVAEIFSMTLNNKQTRWAIYWSSNTLTWST